MEEQKRGGKGRISKSKYIMVFVLTTLIFIIGLVLGNYISSSKLKNIQNLEQELRTDTMSLEIEYLMLAESPCRQANSTSLTDLLYKTAKRLDYMERELGKKNEDVLRLKEYYSLLELKHWLLQKKEIEKCNSSRNIILYFYSNLEDCDACEEQGFILDYLREKREGLSIYSFDTNINNLAINTLKRLYKIENEKAPIVIVNDNYVKGFRSKNEIESVLE